MRGNARDAIQLVSGKGMTGRDQPKPAPHGRKRLTHNYISRRWLSDLAERVTCPPFSRTHFFPQIPQP